ncbi:MAG: DUF3899 domain-containing protein [Sporolactobacillus sp.]|jgi:cation transport ATPase|nr:DUF3899 domain-containing protein [Sporolactobacillus sp.]
MFYAGKHKSPTIKSSWQAGRKIKQRRAIVGFVCSLPLYGLLVVQQGGPADRLALANAGFLLALLTTVVTAFLWLRRERAFAHFMAACRLFFSKKARRQAADAPKRDQRRMDTFLVYGLAIAAFYYLLSILLVWPC